MVFRVKVDEHASLVLRNSTGKAWDSVENRSSDAMVHTWLATTQKDEARPLDCSDHNDMSHRRGLVSCPQAYFSAEQAAQWLSVVINIEDGRLHSFAWDNSCKPCPSSCLHSSRALNLTTLQGADEPSAGGACSTGADQCPSGTGACDLRIFVTWAGTDKNGKNARSAGRRISRFTGDSLSSLADGVFNMATQ